VGRLDWIDGACRALGFGFRAGITSGQSWQFGIAGFVDNMFGVVDDRVDFCLSVLVYGKCFVASSRAFVTVSV
jgi:hypothetical protein